MAYEFEKEILEANVVNVVPSYAPFCETYFYLQEATEKDYNQLMFDIGIQELGVLEATGSEIIYEADEEKAASVKDKIIAFIKAQWEKVKGAFDKMLKAIQEKMAAAKAKFSGNVIAKIKKNLEAGRLKDKEKGFGKFAKYDGLDKIAALSASALKTEEATTDADVSIDELKKKYRGEEFDVDRQWIASNVDFIVKTALDFKFAKGSILKGYNDVKKGFDEEIKKVKVGPVEVKVKTDAAKAHVKTLNKIASAAVALYVERQSRALGLLTKVAVGTLAKSETEKAVAKEDKEAKKAAKAAEKEAKKAGKKEEAKQEAAVMESYTSEIEKMFDWNF